MIPSASSPHHLTSKDEKAFALIPYERNLILERMRERVEDAFKDSEDVKAPEEEKAAESIPEFAEDEKAAAAAAATSDRCESRVSTASTGLSLIFDNYQDDDDDEEEDS